MGGPLLRIWDPIIKKEMTGSSRRQELLLCGSEFFIGKDA